MSAILRPVRQLRLRDHPFHTSVSGNGQCFVTCSRDGKCGLFSGELNQLSEIDFGPGVEWVQLNDSGSLLLVGFNSHVDGYTTSGDLSRSFRLAASGTNLQCCVINDAEQVVCVASWYDKPKISTWDLTCGRAIAESPLPARGGEGYMLVPHPEGSAMAAIAYSGQGESWMFWAHYAHGRLRVWEKPEIEDISLPVFHPTGRELVSRNEGGGLSRIRFPSGELIAAIRPENAFPDNANDGFSYDIHFTHDDRLLARQECLAFYECDLATLRPIRAVLTGADGMTFGEDRFFSGQSWRLSGNRLLTIDHNYDRMMQSSTATLRLWDASSLFAATSLPDAARPYTKMLFAND